MDSQIELSEAEMVQNLNLMRQRILKGENPSDEELEETIRQLRILRHPNPLSETKSAKRKLSQEQTEKETDDILKALTNL